MEIVYHECAGIFRPTVGAACVVLHADLRVILGKQFLIDAFGVKLIHQRHIPTQHHGDLVDVGSLLKPFELVGANVHCHNLLQTYLLTLRHCHSLNT